MTQLFATDLDGTLLNSYGEVSTTNVEAIKNALDSGLHVVFVTGRPPRWMHRMGEVTGHHGHAICANGALVLDVATGEVISANYLSRELGLEIVQQLRNLDSGMSFAVEVVDDENPFLLDHTYQPRWEIAREVPRISVTEMFTRPSVVKLLARPSKQLNVDADQFVHAAHEVVGHLADLTNSNSDDALLEVSPLGVNKGSALANFANDLGIAQSLVAAVGDMPNDVPMIKWAGTGAAVANAHAQVKEVADLLLPSNDEDAVAVFINQILNA